MSPPRRVGAIPARLLAALGEPGVIIGVLSLLSFGFGLVVLADEYHHPSSTGKKALHRIIEGWPDLDDYLGYTLADHAERWRSSRPEDRPEALRHLRQALGELGGELSSHDAQLRLIRTVALELGPRGGPPLATWRAESIPAIGGEVESDRVLVTVDDGRSPPIELTVRYRVVPEVAGAVAEVETSYHRLLLALIGLSGYSLLCLGYMALHARAQGERIAREAAAAATLDLADRTCHELGNVAFVVANERRNLSSHIELLERFVAEDAAAHAEAARRAGIEPIAAARFEQALRREYADRGIDPEFELKGSAAIARDVCRQIAACSDYIALTVRELDGYLKRSTMPVELAPIALDACVDDALTLLAPRLEAAEARVERRPSDRPWPSVLADRRLLIHALVNLIKNAVEAATSAGTTPQIRLTASPAGQRVEVVVSDDGPGISPQALRRIFEPGYSTKGSGRGLGLVIVRQSIEVQGGTLVVKSRPGQGTEFMIALAAAPVA